MSMTAHFHTAAMRLFYVTVMAPLRYLDGVPDGSRLLHEKRTPENFTTRKFPDLRYLSYMHYTSMASAHNKWGRDRILALCLN